jgi:predicted nucleic acid-binding protein
MASKRRYFFDTSALVKYHHEEKGSQAVNDLWEAAEAHLFISRLSVLELISAFALAWSRKLAVTSSAARIGVSPFGRLLLLARTPAPAASSFISRTRRPP